MTNNAITNASDYRRKVKSTLPTLLILDGFGFDEPITYGAAAGNVTECSSSLTSDLSKDDGSSLSDRNCDSNVISRPMSGQFVIDAVMPTISTKRPSTAGKFDMNLNDNYTIRFLLSEWPRKWLFYFTNCNEKFCHWAVCFDTIEMM